MEKKKKKLSKKGQNVEEILEAFEEPKPSFRNTLPFQLPRLVYCSIVAIPSAFRVLGALRKEQELRKARELQEQESVRQLELEAEQKRL